MGTPVPPETPGYEPGKYYRVGVDAFQDETHRTGCDQDYIGEFTGCVMGWEIDWWLPDECTYGRELRIVSGYTAQRLLYARGPYDTLEACQAGL